MHFAPEQVEAWVAKHFEYKKRPNGELVIANPFYSNDKLKLNISVNGAFAHDWRGDQWAGAINPATGRHSATFIRFVQLYLQCSFPEAIRSVVGVEASVGLLAKLRGRTATPEPKTEAAVALPKRAKPLTGSSGLESDMLKSWLASRGVLESDIALYKIHAQDMDVVWPYYEFDELVYWQSRNRLNKFFTFPTDIVVDDKPVGKGDYLFGFDQVEPGSHVIVTEAIFGVHTLEDQAVASGGAVLTGRQVKKLKFLDPQGGVILAADNDGPGIESVANNYRLLVGHGLKAYHSLPPKLEYVKDGKVGYTKDWNELIERLGMSKVEIGKLFELNIRKLNDAETMRLRQLL